MTAYDPHTLRELQAHELVILDAVADVCRRHGIPWFLDAGTALGAVRHGGFIPWDDDVDIAMLREDYDRFLSVAPTALPSWLRLDVPAENPTMATVFAKVCLRPSAFETIWTRDAGYAQGIYIDIFPYDLIAEDERVRKRQFWRARQAMRLLYLLHTPHIITPHRTEPLRTLERLAFRGGHGAARLLTTHERLLDYYNSSLALGRANADGIDDPLISLDHYRTPIRKSLIFPLGSATFCGETYPIPGQIDAFLTNLFGDWRQLPPPEARKSHQPIRLIFPE